MKPKILLNAFAFLLCLLCCATSVFSQTSIPGLTTVIPPSPNVQAFQKYGDIPVSPYTGVPNISVPLYTINFRDITLPISLSYHASGIKVQEEATSVGLGWVLNAGGTISRNIVGNDDFNSNTYFNFGSFTGGVFTKSSALAFDMTNGFYPQYNVQTDPNCNISYITARSTDTAINMQYYFDSGPKIDFQPDLYYFNIPNQNGKFVLDRNYNAILAKQAKIAINCLDPAGSTWRITTEDGFIYDFTQYETVHTGDDPTLRKIAWYLTKMTSPTGNYLTFNYANDGTSVSSAAGDYFEMWDAWQYQIANPLGGSATPVSITNGHQITQKPGSIYSAMRLTSIDYNTGRVVFTYSNNRQDLSGSGYELDNISVYTKDNQGNISSTALKSYAFNYSYFTGSSFPGFLQQPTPPATSPTEFRLRLDKVTESGTYNGQPVTANPYIFSYYQGGNWELPDKSSYSRDHWGYFNGWNATNGPTSSLIPSFHQGLDPNNVSNFYLGIPGNERDSNPAFMQAYSLQSITYPTGGNTLFEYEANDCDEQNSELNDHSGNPYLYSVVKSPTDANHLSSFSWTKGSSSGTQILDNRNIFQINNNMRINGTFSAMFRLDGSTGAQNSITNGQVPNNVAYITLTNIDNGQVITIDPGGYHTYTTATLPSPAPTGPYVLYVSGLLIQMVNLPDNITPGRYNWNLVCNNTGYGQYMVNGLMNYNWYTQVNDNPTYDNAVTYSYVGGLRIKRITDHDGVNSDKIRKYIYHYTADKNGDGILEEYSYGRRMSRPEYSYFDISAETWSETGAGGVTYSFPYFGEHLIRTSDSNIPLNGSASGSVVGYDQVTELYGENGENGETIYKYHNNTDVVNYYNSSTQFNTPIYPYIFRKRPYNSDIADPLNGSLSEQQDYVRNPTGQFTLIRDVTNTYITNLASQNLVYALEDRTLTNHAILDGNPTTPLPLPDCERYVYTYSTLQSQWQTLETSDVKTYGLSDATKVQDTHIHYYYENPNHYQLTKVVTYNSDGTITTAHTSYPLDFTLSNPSDPLSNGIQNMIAKHVVNAPVEKYTQITDGSGNNGRYVSAMLNQYSTAFPLLNVVNLLQISAPLTTFTPLTITSTTTTRNSAYNPAIVIDAYDANGNMLQKHKYLDINTSYHWAYNNSYPIAECKNAASNEFYFEGFEDNTSSGVIAGGHTGAKASTTSTVSWTIPNSRTYVITYWYLSSGVWKFSGEQPYTGNTYTLTGGTAYDDIRIFPNDAEMTTYTYDTLVGITSSSDAKGMPTYYEYDGLSRLMNVKDKDGNIIKNYKYHYEPQVQ